MKTRIFLFVGILDLYTKNNENGKNIAVMYFDGIDNMKKVGDNGHALYTK